MILNINNANDVMMFISMQVENGIIQRSTGVSLKSTWRRVMQSVFGNNWLAISMNNLTAEKINDRYGKMMAGRYRAETIRIDKSRVRRIMKDIEDAKKTQDAKEERLDGSVMELVRAMRMAQEIFMPELRGKVFKPEGEKEYDYFSVPIDAKKIVGLALPNDLSLEELKRAKTMLSGVFICEEVKKKGGA